MTLALAFRSGLILALALLAVAIMRRRSAAARHAVLAAGFAATLLVPLSAFVPRLPVRVPESRATRAVTTQFAQPLSDVLASRSESTSRFDVARIAFLFWISGAFVLVARLARQHRAASVLRRAAARRGEVYVVDDIVAPLTVGITSPRIVVPTSFELWPRPDRDAALLHERAHVARRDTGVQLLADLACCAYWFNPLFWIGRRWLRLECERACDDRVLATGHDAGNYASLLLRLARTAGRTPAAMAIRPSELESRIAGLLDSRTRRHPLGRTPRLLLAAIAIVVAIPVGAIIPTGGLDPYLDPLSERVPGRRDIIPTAAAAVDEAAIIDRLREGAAKRPEWRGDLVADRSRWALAQVENGRIVEPLIRALHDDDWRVRGYAAWALALAGDRRATADLIPLLTRPVWRERAAAAFALHYIADRTATNAMENALHDDAWQVRVEATAFFVEIGDKRRVLSMQSDRHAAVRLTVAEAMAR